MRETPDIKTSLKDCEAEVVGALDNLRSALNLSDDPETCLQRVMQAHSELRSALQILGLGFAGLNPKTLSAVNCEPAQLPALLAASLPDCPSNIASTIKRIVNKTTAKDTESPSPIDKFYGITRIRGPILILKDFEKYSAEELLLVSQIGPTKVYDLRVYLAQKGVTLKDLAEDLPSS